MQPTDDSAWLRQYVENRSDAAFAALVTRHVSLVYSVALRHVGNPHDAEEITQAVFVILARKAAGLSHEKALSSWLFQATRLTAANFLRGESRRHRREQEAYMQSVVNESGSDIWPEIAPLLDSAVEGLREKDRRAIVLRFYEGRDLRDVGLAMGASEDAAQKRVNRALEKLRNFFTRRGVTLTTAAIAGAVAANSVQAAPVGLAASAASAAVKGTTVALSTARLVQGALKSLARAKYKLLIGYGAVALVAGSAVVIVVQTHPFGAPVAPLPATNGPAVQMPAATVPVVREPLADTMKISLDSAPGGLAVQPDGKIVVGTTLFGFFVDEKSGALGYYTRGAFRLNPDGSLDRNFLCEIGRHDSAAQMAHVAPAANGEMLLSGAFESVNGRPRPGYAVLQLDGEADASFEPWRGSTNTPGKTGLPAGIFPATRLPDGSVAIMSESVEGPRTPYPPTVYRLDATGKWIPPETKVLASEFSRPSGLMTTLGPVGFWARKTVDWTRATPAARRPPFQAQGPPSDLPGGTPVADLPFERCNEPPSAVDAATVLRALFEEVPIELCRYAVRLPDGGAILAVRDKVIDGSLTAPGRFMRFDKNWTPDFSFTNAYEADLRSCLTIKRQKDGKFLVAGLMGKMNGEDFPGLVRLDENGQIDRSFHCETTNSWEGRVMDLTIQDDGRIVICGFFSHVNGVEVPHLARLNPDGSLDQTFRPPFLTVEQFSRARFAGMRRVPVARLNETAGTTGGTEPAATVPAVAPQNILITSMRLQGGVAVIEFTGAPRGQYVLQARESLNGADWVNLSTNQAAADGRGMFRDTEASKHATRFYRIASP